MLKSKLYVLILSCLLSLGCEEVLNRVIDDLIPGCVVPPDMEGTFEIRGSGERSLCSDETLNSTDIDISSVLLTFSTNEEDRYLFDIDTEFDSFSSTGGYATCEGIEFDTTEVYEDSVIVYEWRASAESLNLFIGTFTAEGPDTCRSTGTFELIRR